MQRSIKFRVFSKIGAHKNRMIEWVELKAGSLVDIGNIPNQWEVMEFTGLKDKNDQGDTDIYENDIVYIAGTGNCIVGICPVLGVFFRSISDNGAVESAHDVLMENDLGAVIGNIYQSPHLLEQS
jgi:hypothetical protein